MRRNVGHRKPWVPLAAWRTAATMPGFVVALCAFAGCAADSRPNEEALAAASSPITSGDTTVVTRATTNPEAAVGALRIVGVNTPTGLGGCSGIAIKRDLVLSAAHCFCGAVTPFPAANVTFTLPFVDAAGTLQFEQRTGVGNVLTLGNPIACVPNAQPDKAPYDIALVPLAGNLVNLGAPVMPYVSGDFLHRVFSKEELGFFQGPARVIGFNGGAGSALPATLVRTAGTIHHVRFDSDCIGDILGIGGTCANYIYDKPGSGGTRTQQGDSGGPFTFMQSGTTPTVFGVISGQESGITDTTNYAPTYAAAADLIRNNLNDADEDGVRDAVDNCPPSRCKDDITKCRNPLQEDLDGDGVGDACDSCPPSLCVSRGQAATVCRNLPVGGKQPDLDGDGVGDACDTCPAFANKYDQGTDVLDGDGVGYACDSCKSVKNSFPACATDADCLRVRVDGGFEAAPCILEGPRFGKCRFSGATCSGGTDCAALEPCDSPGTFGRCAKQLDDLDNDGLGDSCDSCPRVANSTVQANSNPEAEAFARSLSLDAPSLGDACDPVPVYTPRPVLPFATFAYDSKKFSVMTATAGIGVDGFDPPTPVQAQVGFRHCDCHDPLDPSGSSDPISAGGCFAAGSCERDSRFFTDPTGHWRTVTVQLKPGVSATPPALPPVAGTDPPGNRTFRRTITCADTTIHPDGVEHEECRVGTLESLYWHQAVDIERGAVPSFGTTTKRTVGLFWSHVSSLGTFSPRDTATARRLRENYQLVKTPLTSALGSGLTLPSAPATDFDFGGRFVFRPDLIIDLLDDPIPYDNEPQSVFHAVPTIARLIPSAGQILAVSGPSDPIVDVTGGLSPGVKALIATPGTRWVTPVEGGGRIYRNALRAVAMPRVWTGNEVPRVVVSTAAGLGLSNEQQQPPNNIPLATAARAPDPTRTPGPRNDSEYLLSATENSLFMFGGTITAAIDPLADMIGQPSPDIWSLDLASGRWRPELESLTALGEARLGPTLGLTVSTDHRRLVVLDEVKSKLKLRFVRILTVDRITQEARARVLIPRIAAWSRIGVIAADDGVSYYLTAQSPYEKRWFAYRFRFGSDGKINWTGIATEHGTIADRPVATKSGTFLFVVDSGKQRAVRLEEQTIGSSLGCTQL